MPKYPARFPEGTDLNISDIELSPKGEHLECDWGNAETSAADNVLRARWAAEGLQAYGERVCPSDGEPPETVITDFLGDLMHLCDALDLGFDALVESAQMHYEAELRGDF